MIFGGYRSKVEQIISMNFSDGNRNPYRVLGNSKIILDDIISLVRKNGGNHFDAAIIFMFSQTEAMAGDLSTEMTRWRERTQNRAKVLAKTKGKIALQVLNEHNQAASDQSEAIDGSAVVMRSLMEAAGVFTKPAIFCKPQVLCYLYGWCDATLQKLSSNDTDGAARMLMLFSKIYEPLGKYTPLDSDAIAAQNLRAAIELVKSGAFAEWVQLGGEDFCNLADANDFNFNLRAAIDA